MIARNLMTGLLAALAVTGVRAVELTAANAEVVVEKGASETTRFAAEEMADFLSQALGGTIPLVNRPTEGRASVIVGDSEWSRAEGLEPARHPQDTYLIRATVGRIYVLGKDDPEPRALRSSLTTDYHDFERGSVHGVYAFLEKYAGVRFYFVGPLGTVVPKRASIVVPEISEAVTPDYLIRQYYAGHEAAWFETPTPTPRGAVPEQLNWLRLRLGTKGMPRCHGSRLFRYLDRFRTSHPEYFALKSNGGRHNDPAELHPGHLCYSSDVREVMYRDVKAALTGRDPSERGLKAWGKNVLGKMVDIMPEDGLQMCHCKACQATIAREAKGRYWATPLVWRNTADIAQRLIDEGVEGTITQMAYSDYRGLPDFDLPTNIIVQVAENGPWTIPDPKRLEAENAEIRAWVGKLGHKVWLWNYPCKVITNRLKIEGLPPISHHYWGEYYKMQAPYIIGAFAESETERYSFNYLNYYVYSRVCWDTKTDVQAILDEHHRLMFGAGAPEMAKLYDELEEIWVGKMAANVVETELGPLAVVPSDADIWSKVYSPEVLARLEGHVAAARTKSGEGSLEARRAELIGREYVGSLRAAAKRFAVRQAAVNAFRTRGAETNEIPLRPLAQKKSRLPKARVATKVRTWRTQDALRIVFDCEEPHMDCRAVAVRERDADAVWSDDNVQVVLFPGGDRRVQYHVAVNSEGSVYDVKTERLGARGGKEDRSWDCRAKVDIAKRADGWTCDVTIPIRAFHAFESAVPMNLCRTRSLAEGLDGSGNYAWGPETLKGFQDAENFGTVEF